MWKRIVSVMGATLAVCIAVPATAGAASEYDDLVEKVTTKTLINYVDNYHGKTCGSPTDDYAKKWFYSFKRQKSFANPHHPEAVASLEKAINSPAGAYAVIYTQKNNHNNNSSASLAAVYWTEDGRDDFELSFQQVNKVRRLVVQRKAGSHKQLYFASIASPALQQINSNYCIPEFFLGYTSGSTSQFAIDEIGHNKLLSSNFRTVYPENYSGLQINSDDPGAKWQPETSEYEDLLDKITTKKLINYINNYYGKSCGSFTSDYSNQWITLFEHQSRYYERPYHQDAVASLRRAMAYGDYVVVYDQRNSIKPLSPYLISVYWTETKGAFRGLFLGEDSWRSFSIVRSKGINGSERLHSAVIASPRLLQNFTNQCDPAFLWGYSQYQVSEVHIREDQHRKLFTSTFNVEYPDGYKSKPIPGDRRNVTYLALGDSFSSGEGDTDKNPATGRKYYRQWTDVKEDKAKGAPREKCHVSTRSYPYKLANWMGLGSGPSAAWASVVCSGATVYDMNWDNSGGYEGQDSPLGRLHGYDNKGTLQKMALNEMIPGRVKQIEFVKKYQPKVITLTAGGNDVDFGGKLANCAIYPVSCNWATSSKRNELKNDLRNQFDKLKNFYDELKSASSHKAKIYVLGYPQFVNGDPNAKCKSTLNLDNREREMITNAVTYYNSVIKQAARAAGVKYIDTETALGNHRLCDQTDSYVNGVASLRDLAFSGSELQESFHPNAKGHSAIAARFKEELRGENPLHYENCPGTGKLYCPDDSATKKSIPDTEYFTVQNEDEDMRVVHYQSASGQIVKKEILTIKTHEIPYKSLSPIKITLYSNPIKLGEVFAGADGKIDSSVTIPATIPAGYHTLELSGVDEKGHKLNLYQTILIKGPNPDDIDENGTPDKNQPCGAFIQAANKDEDLDGIDDACDPEITDPILYTARNGKSSLGEDEDRIYLFRNTRAANLTGVTNDYVGKSKNQNNADALIGHTLSEETRGLAFEKLVIMKEDDGDIKKGTPIVLAKDVNEKCYALKPEDYLSPALKPGSKEYKLRGLIKLNTLPKGVGCEEQ